MHPPAENVRVTHLAFADESHWNTDRYRALGLVTLEAQWQVDIEQAIKENLIKHGITGELKWSKIDRDRDRDAACDLLRTALGLIAQNQLRVDVLIWDIEDSRHKVRRRDDLNNLQRLLYRICIDVLTRRWPAQAHWTIYADQQSGIDWDNLPLMLRRGLARHHRQQPPQLIESVSSPSIAELRPVTSHATPIVMLADLFSGLAVFSHEHWTDFQEWRQEQRGQRRLPPTQENERLLQLSKRTKMRFSVLDTVLTTCHQLKLDTTLDTCEGLRTRDPACPLNFWFYRPQGAYDKAPQKQKKVNGEGFQRR